MGTVTRVTPRFDADGMPLALAVETYENANGPQPECPGKMRQAVNYFRSGVKHIAAGLPQATDEIVAARWAICQRNACGFFRLTGEGVGQCLHPTCGCDLRHVGLTGRNKLRWADSACPVGLWSPVASGEANSGDDKK